MAQKINEIEMSTVENKNEELWFSALKQIIKEINFGQVEVNLTIKNSKVTNIAQSSKRNINIGSN